MTDPINLAQLRESCEATAAGYRGTDLEVLATVSLHADTLLALIDATEAAREYLSTPDNSPAEGRTYDLLRDALARFTDE
jgi:hypothetical protein